MLRNIRRLRFYYGWGTIAAPSRSINFQKLQLSKFKLPEKFRGTIVDQWAIYWQNLFRDYADALKDVLSEVKNKPWKGIVFAILLGSSSYCIKNNPDENSFRDKTLTFSNELILIGPSVRNPRAGEHLKLIEQSYNEGKLRRFSFGLFSIIWIDNYSKNVGLFKSTCIYLKPDIFSFHHRILDVGFLNEWWVINAKMIDFDVNPQEWESFVV